MIAPLLNAEERRQRSAPGHPIGRMGTAADIAQLALYLASDESASITGSLNVIDGGFTAQ
jgi:NAD(P)-dependent dehydrogenase (short-subunit alcohol dehydrogenase family)